MKPSHFRTPRQLDDATFYSSQTSEPVSVAPECFDIGTVLVTRVGAIIIVGVLAAVALGVI